MKNGPCPECGSTKVYGGKGTDHQGLRDDNTIFLCADGLEDIFLDVYVCLDCGYVRSFVSANMLAQVAEGIRKSKPWKQVT